MKNEIYTRIENLRRTAQSYRNAGVKNVDRQQYIQSILYTFPQLIAEHQKEFNLVPEEYNDMVDKFNQYYRKAKYSDALGVVTNWCFWVSQNPR